MMGYFGSIAPAQCRTGCQIQGFFKAGCSDADLQQHSELVKPHSEVLNPILPTAPHLPFLLFHSKREIQTCSYHSSERPALANPALSRSIGLGDLHRSLPISAGSQVCDTVIFFRSLSDLLILWVMLKELQKGIFPQYFQASHHIEGKSVFVYLQLREETGNVAVIGREELTEQLRKGKNEKKSHGSKKG